MNHLNRSHDSTNSTDESIDPADRDADERFQGAITDFCQKTSQSRKQLTHRVARGMRQDSIFSYKDDKEIVLYLIKNFDCKKIGKSEFMKKIKKDLPQFQVFSRAEIYHRMQQLCRKTARDYLWCVMYGLNEHGVDRESNKYSEFIHVRDLLAYYLLGFGEPSRPKTLNEIEMIQLD